MESKKRERAVNFSTPEVEFLVTLVEKYKNIIENKKTDAVTNKDKERTWKRIESLFNSRGISTNLRTWKTLKLKYEGIKKNTKKKSSMQRQEMYKTGGGPSNAPDFNNFEEKVLSICSNIQGLEARYDSDTITTPATPVDQVVIFKYNETEENIETDKDLEDPVLIQDIIEEGEETQKDFEESIILNSEDKDEDESQKENKWDRWHPKALKNRVSDVLKVTKNTVTSKLDQLTASRMELVRLQTEIAKQQHEFVKLEHQKKMEHLANDEKRKEEIHALLVEKLKCDYVTAVDMLKNINV